MTLNKCSGVCTHLHLEMFFIFTPHLDSLILILSDDFYKSYNTEVIIYQTSFSISW